MNEISNLPAIAVTFTLAWLVLNDCHRDLSRLVSARNVYLLTISAWYMMEAILLPEEVQKYSQNEHLIALASIGLSVLGFLISYNMVRGEAFKGMFSRLAAIQSPRLVWAVFICAAVVGTLPLIWIANGNLLLLLDDAFVPKKRWASVFQRKQYGGLRDVMLELQMFQRAALPFAATIIAQQGHRMEKKLFSAVFLAYMFGRAFNSGTRSSVVEVILPMAAALYWRASAKRKRQMVLYGIPSFFILGLAWSAATVSGRNEGRVAWENAADVKYVGFEMFRELLYLERNIPERSGYLSGMSYFVQLVNPIPRFIWPDKPSADAGLELSKLQGSVVGGQTFLTTSPGLIGEMYWNFGYIGIFVVSMVLGWLAKSWDAIRILATRSPVAFMVFAAGIAIIFLSGRSVNAATIYGMLAIYVLLVFYGSRRPKQSRTQSKLAPAATPSPLRR